MAKYQRGHPITKLELHRVPFFLEPGYCSKPEGWYETHTSRMVRKFGSLEAFERVKVAHRLMSRAAEAGLDAEGWSDPNLDRRQQSSTLRAHRLIWWLDQTRGWEAAEAAYTQLGKAHFVEGELIDDVAVCVAAAAVAGVDHDEATLFLRSAEGEREVFDTVETVQQLGIHSIPTLLVNGEIALSGAAGYADVLSVLQQSGGSTLGRRRFASTSSADS